MSGNLDLKQLKAEVEAGSIDTVLVCAVDMQGRQMGKRFHARDFIDNACEETHCCNYMLATDLEMFTVQGYAATGWLAGYGDFVMKPDLATLRRVPWLEGTAMVLCDLVDQHTHEEIVHSPRAILKVQAARLKIQGMKAMMASELEFFLFEDSYEAMRNKSYAALKPISAYNEDYHIFQTTKEEGLMRAVRNGLYGAGIPVENTKGEAEAGQGEINVRYADALEMADNHVIVKNGCKEIAWQHGRALTFLAKWSHARAGSSCHIHQSLWSADRSKPLFCDPKREYGMSDLMRHYVAGLLEHSDEITYFLAPYVNSYKRFVAGTFAPTRVIWSRDNRTAGYRLCGEGTRGIRIECRIGGADLTPHLAMAALLAAGLDGIERKLELPPPYVGDAYKGRRLREIPRTLRAAAEILRKSRFLRSAFGDEVINHYHRAALWEQEECDRVVTDWEVARGFERC